MFEDETKAKDELEITLTTGVGQSERKKYKVINQLFKNGKVYKKGSLIELDELTAANFIKSGDIENA